MYFGMYFTDDISGPIMWVYACNQENPSSIHFGKADSAELRSGVKFLNSCYA